MEKQAKTYQDKVDSYNKGVADKVKADAAKKLENAKASGNASSIERAQQEVDRLGKMDNNSIAGEVDKSFGKKLEKGMQAGSFMMQAGSQLGGAKQNRVAAGPVARQRMVSGARLQRARLR